MQALKKSYSDKELEQKIMRLEGAIQAWGEKHEVWYDSSFVNFLQHVDGEPDDHPVITILCTDGELGQVLDGSWNDQIQDEFHELVDSLGYECENQNGVNYYFYAKDEELNAAFEAYFKWQWVCSLIKPDFGDIYQEIYGHFGSRPEDLHKLSPRNFEILLSRIFQAQGFKTELGPGSGDGGIDVKFWQRDPIGDILTLVQAKRYAPHKKIKLEAVAALRGVMAVEKAPRGMFVTTSTYLPSAKKFAGRESNVIDLKTTVDVAEWCAAAEQGIIADKSTLISDDFVARLLGRVALGNDPRVVHATTGYNMVINVFALVLKETKHAALLMGLPAQKVSDDGYGQRGAEIPSFGIEALTNRRSELVWRAKRDVDERGRATYWDGRHLFCVWDGNSKPFDYVD